MGISFQTVLQSVAGSLVFAALVGLYKKYFDAGRFLSPQRVLKILRGRTVRFSSSTLLRIDVDGGYVLILTPERSGPAHYGPVGGVLKYSQDIESKKFGKWNVRNDREFQTENDDMNRDLRVRMPRGSFFRFASWYRHKSSRETPHEAMKREIKEEVPGLSVNGRSAGEQAVSLHFENVHRSHKTFKDRHGEVGLIHVREFQVLSIERDELGAAFENEIIRAARAGEHNLRIVRPEQIDAGTVDGVRIGAHAIALYRVNLNNTREDEPVRKVSGGPQ